METGWNHVLDNPKLMLQLQLLQLLQLLLDHLQQLPL